MHAIAELIQERRAALGQYQSEVAAWFQEWRLNRNIWDELRRYQDTDPDIVDAIRTYVTDNGRYRPDEQTSQGAVSKWERGVIPAPDKWVALAEWLELPLRTVVQAMNTEVTEPAAAESRLAALRKSRADLEAACRERDETADMLRAESATNERLADEVQRLTVLLTQTKLGHAKADADHASEIERLARVVRLLSKEVSDLRLRVTGLPTHVRAAKPVPAA